MFSPKTGMSIGAVIFLTFWCLAWTIGLGLMIFYGQIRLGSNGNVEIISRFENPIWYWSIVTIIFLMICFVLSLAYEWRGPSGAESKEQTHPTQKQ